MKGMWKQTVVLYLDLYELYSRVVSGMWM